MGLADLHAVVSAKLAKTNPRDVTRCSLLEGLLYRLNPLVQGSAAGQYAPGEGSFPIETLSSPWGLTILEGGAFLDEFSKAFLLGWAAWHLYTDAMVRRIRRASGPESYLQIFFEEANKILAGVSSGSGDDENGGPTTGEQFAAMWRDSRK